NGGGIWFNALNETLSITKATITGNTASGGTGGTPGGGGIYVGSSDGAVVTLTFSRLAGNTAPNGRNLDRISGGVGASVTAQNNWWGTNLSGGTISGSVTFDPFISLTHTASPTTIRTNQSSTLTADMSKDNHGSGATLTGNLDVLNGVPITF